MSDLRPVLFTGLLTQLGISLVFFFGFMDFEASAMCSAAVVVSVLFGIYLQVRERKISGGGANG